MANESILLRERVMKKSAIKVTLNLVLLGVLAVAFNPVQGNTDMKAMEAVQKARELKREGKKDHSKHVMPAAKVIGKYRGVYYGYLPCKDCDGVKMTLSLKNKHNYLLVTQSAKSSSREYYDKGKYVWDDKTQVVTLTSRKNKRVRHYTIKDESTLIPFTKEDKVRTSNQEDYLLLRSDTVKNREVHIH